MATGSQLAPWGHRARSAFRDVFGPVLGLTVSAHAIAELAAPIKAVWHGPFVAAWAVAIFASFVLTGLAWLCAEIQAGYRGPQSQ